MNEELLHKNSSELFEDIQAMFYDYESSREENILALYQLLLDELIDLNFDGELMHVPTLMFTFLEDYRSLMSEIERNKKW